MIPFPMIPSPTKFVIKAHDHADNWFEQSPVRGNTRPKEMDLVTKALRVYIAHV